MRSSSARRQGAPHGPTAKVVRLERRRLDPGAARVLEVVAAARGVTVPMLLHRHRCRAEVALARQIAMYLMHVELSRQYLDVGVVFGRDRTTIAYACAVVEDLREDLAFDAEMDQLAALLAHEVQQHEVRHAG